MQPYLGRKAFLALFVGMRFIVAALLPTDADAQTPTADQIEAFKNLTPEQQRAILERMGGGEGGIKSDRDISAPETIRPRTTTTEEEQTTRAGEKDYRDRELRPKELRIQGRDTVLLEANLKPADPMTGRARDDNDTVRLQKFLDRMLRSNPYKLDADGVLRIPGVGPIALAGLTERQASERLNSDPLLRDFNLKATLLPLQKLGAEGLKPFGYDLFAGVPSTFAPVTDIPVPSQYIVGPGDRLEVQLIGNSKGRYSLVVNRDGRVMFPDLGPIAVAGLTFDDARTRIEARVRDQMLGTQVVVSMGDLRSIRVFVLGEAEHPGSYTVSGLATITNALFASGGVKKIGSLRKIQLKRGGRVVSQFDLYDLLLKGDTSKDVKLLPGDVIFIPPVGSTVGVTGEIRRPAIYELVGDSTVADLIYLGGGLTPEADARLATVERINEGQDRTVVDVDLSVSRNRDARLRSGDTLVIPSARPSFANSVRLDGNVYRPGVFQYRSGLRLVDVLPTSEELKPDSDLHYVLIRRERQGTKRAEVLSADLAQAWLEPNSSANPPLAANDQVIVFNLESGRSQYLDPILDALRLQASQSEPSQVASVSGSVRFPGDYPLEPNMTISALIRAGGGLAEQAFDGQAELTRYQVRDGQRRETAVLNVDLSRALAGDTAADMRVMPFDVLTIRSVPEWSEQNTVTIDGEVRFPGTYPLAKGETLRSVVARAGGLTPLSFADGSVFVRQALKERERQQLKMLAERLKKDLATLALQSAQSGSKTSDQAAETLTIGQSLLADLENAQPVGRLVINLDQAIAAKPGSIDDLILKPGDVLHVPARSQEVTVIGEVQSPTSLLYEQSLDRDAYIRMSGGTTQKADTKRIYVVRASGAVAAESGSRWFRSDSGVRPGDTIVVPLDAEHMKALPMWTAVTTILYNIAIAVAAVHSL